MEKTLKKKVKKAKKTKSFIKKLIQKQNRTHEYNLVQLFFMGVIATWLDILRIIKNIVLVVLCLCVIGGIAAFAVWKVKFEPTYKEYDKFAKECIDNSSEDTFIINETSYIYDSNGKLLSKLKGDQDATYIKYDEIPSDIVNAFIAVEDRSFWENPGIDVKGLMAAGYDAIKSKGENIRGASTITQQLSRNIFLTHEVSLERKFKEMLIAIKMTKKYTKEQIMEFYCNDICFANAYYGIEAAAKGYFNKSSQQLSLSEMAYICAIPNSPEYYNPYKHPERALERRDKILSDMYSLGYITESEYNEALNEEIEVCKTENPMNDYQTTFAMDCVAKWIMKENNFEFRYTFENIDDYNSYKKNYDEVYEQTYNSIRLAGYKIYTSLDSDIQENLQNIVNEDLKFNDEISDNGVLALQGAVTVIDNESNKVIAVIGGRTAGPNDDGELVEVTSDTYTLNRAFQSYRQPGSSIKPLVVYTPALMSGYTPTSIVYNIDVDAAKEKGVDVQTLTGEPMELQKALWASKNGVAWQIFDRLGSEYAMSFLQQMEFSKICPWDFGNASSLGGLTYGVTTVEMASAYNALQNHGYYTEPTCITKIVDKDGNDIYFNSDNTSTGRQVYNEKAADIMVEMMTGVLKYGTAAKLNWYKSTNNIAGCKTGTTNNSKDGWLCGFTPQYTVTVWVGYDQPKTLNNLYGATYPGQIWKDCMLSLIDGQEEITEFEKSDAYYQKMDIHSLLPDYAYELYLPGREDDEVLSGDYTVYDYRTDRVTGEKMSGAIQGMYGTSFSDPQWAEKVTNYYYAGVSVANAVRSNNYKAELMQQLDVAHMDVINKYQDATGIMIH